MAKILTFSALGMVAAALLAGCGSLQKNDNVSEAPENYLQPVEQEIDPVAPMTIRVMGYGAPDTVSKNRSDAQRRLLAIRASKMDAYRAMAERVYGMSVQGGTTVRDMVVQNDNFRSYIETFMHGARVVTADVMADGTVETVLEMVVDQGFRNCLQIADQQRFNVDCRAGVARASNLSSSQRQRVQSEASMPESSFYFIQ